VRKYRVEDAFQKSMSGVVCIEDAYRGDCYWFSRVESDELGLPLLGTLELSLKSIVDIFLALSEDGWVYGFLKLGEDLPLLAAVSICE
jgi:hypothetical protein